MSARDGSVSRPTLAFGGVVQTCRIVNGGEIEGVGSAGRFKRGIFTSKRTGDIECDRLSFEGRVDENGPKRRLSRRLGHK